MCRLTVRYRRLEILQRPHIQGQADQEASVKWCNIPEDLNLQEHRLRDPQIPRVLIWIYKFLWLNVNHSEPKGSKQSPNPICRSFLRSLLLTVPGTWTSQHVEGYIGDFRITITGGSSVTIVTISSIYMASEDPAVQDRPRRGASNVQNTNFCALFGTVCRSFDRRQCAGSIVDLGTTLLIITGRIRLSSSVGEGVDRLSKPITTAETFGQVTYCRSFLRRIFTSTYFTPAFIATQFYLRA